MRPSNSSQSQSRPRPSNSHPSSASSGPPPSNQYASYHLDNHPINYSPASLSPVSSPQPAWNSQSQPHPIHPSQYPQSQFYQQQQQQQQPQSQYPPPTNHHFPNPYSSDYAPAPPLAGYPFPQPPLSNRRQSASGNRPPVFPANSSQQSNSLLDPSLGRKSSTSHQPPAVAAQKGLPPRPSVPNSDSPAHGAPGHEWDNCPGCKAEYEAALSASKASAEEDAARRARQEAEEEEHAKAISASQEEEARRRRNQEEQELSLVMEASRREHEEKSRLKEEEERIFLEESRQAALRDEEIRKTRESSQEQDVLEQSRKEADETKRRREAEEERMMEIEKIVMEESRKEQEEEWRRRDSEERAMLMGLQNHNNRDEASYWDHHLRHDEAYQLALQFQEAKLNGRAISPHNQARSSSNPRKRPPLPPTPGSSSQIPSEAQIQSCPHSQSSKAAEARRDRPLPAIRTEGQDTEDDPFGDHAEAPPAYEHASSPSRAPSPIIDVGNFEAVIGSVARNDGSTGPPPEEDDQDESELWTRTVSGNEKGTSRSNHREGSPASDLSRQSSIAEVLLTGDHNRLSVSNPDDRSATPTPSRSSSFASTSRQDQALSPRPSFSSTAPTNLSNPPSPSIAKNGLLSEPASGVDQSPSSSSCSPSPSNSPALQPSSPLPPVSTSTSNSTSPSSSSQSISAETSSSTHVFKQTSLPGVDFGYARVPFSESLFIEPAGSRGSEAESASTPLPTADTSAKKTFPNTIQLTLPPLSGDSLSSDPSNLIGVGGRGSFFVIRAQSWRGLLRAAAWFGNTRIEAGPEEIADAAALYKKNAKQGASRNCRLKVEIEFVTPSRIETGYGIGDLGKYSGAPGGGENLMASAAKARIERDRKSAAHVSLCLSLVRPVGSTVGNDSSNSRSNQGDLLSILKGESRALDSIYLARGSARRVIYLPREPPSLPLEMVALAQHLHRGHQTSAACPTSSHVARHSPRDLHHAIERHDVGYVSKIRKARIEREKLAGGSSRPGLAGKQSGSSSSVSLNGKGKSKQEDEEEQEFFDNEDDDASDEEKTKSGTLGRMKDRVKRRLAKRNGDSKVVNEDLENWITPFDMSNHG